MITCGINILSLFIYPIYEIKDIEILKSGVFVETLEECGFFKKIIIVFLAIYIWVI